MHLSAGRLPAVKAAEGGCAVKGTGVILEKHSGRDRVNGDGRVVKTRGEGGTRFLIANIYAYLE